MAAVPVSVSTGANIGPNPGVGTVILKGWSLYESGGSNPVTLEIRAGGASGQIVAVVKIAAGDDDTQWFGPDGVRVDGRLYVKVGSGTGTPAGVVWVQ